MQQRYIMTVCVALAFAMAFPVLIVPLFAIWSLIFITLATRSAALYAASAGSGFCAVGFDVVMFLSASGRLVVARGSWHIFHADSCLAGRSRLCLDPPPARRVAPNAAPSYFGARRSI